MDFLPYYLITTNPIPGRFNSTTKIIIGLIIVGTIYFVFSRSALNMLFNILLIKYIFIL